MCTPLFCISNHQLILIKVSVVFFSLYKQISVYYQVGYYSLFQIPPIHNLCTSSLVIQNSVTSVIETTCLYSLKIKQSCLLLFLILFNNRKSTFPQLFWSFWSYGFRLFFREKIARVAFYYKERQYVTSRRGELYGPADFLGKGRYNVMDKSIVLLVS
jgi:hypothetical protein